MNFVLWRLRGDPRAIRWACLPDYWREFRGLVDETRFQLFP